LDADHPGNLESFARCFTGVTSRGEVMARYVPYGPVFRWQQNQMIPTPLQGGDLLWWLQAVEEDDDG